MSNIQFRISKNEDTKRSSLVAFINGQLTDPIDDTHPNYLAITEALKKQVDGTSELTPEALLDLFNVAKAVERKFEQLGERVAVKGNQILFDGDPVAGPLEDQIMDFLNEGQDFAPLVKFYEKLATNPLGNVREGLFSWIKGQKDEGNFTISDDGDIIGYKSTIKTKPQWRTDVSTIYIPSKVSRQSDVVAGLEVPNGAFIEQAIGDVVEMPRSKVLNAPSQMCGDGLHVGTWSYAKSFYGGSTVLLVKFSPRDIVSLPDQNSSWKLRVSRYKVLSEVTKPLESVLYSEVEANAPKEDAPNPFKVGQRVTPVSERDHSVGVVTEISSPTKLRADFLGNGRSADSALSFDIRDVKLVEKPDVSLAIDNDYEEINADGPFRYGDILVANKHEYIIDIDQDDPDFDNEWSVTSGYIDAGVVDYAKRKRPTPVKPNEGRGRPGSKRDPRTGRFI